jgi:hypothetical protein
VVAIVYFVVPAASLPPLLGPVRNGHGHHDRRAVAALVIGIGALVASALMDRTLVKRRRRGSYIGGRHAASMSSPEADRLIARFRRGARTLLD